MEQQPVETTVGGVAGDGAGTRSDVLDDRLRVAAEVQLRLEIESDCRRQPCTSSLTSVNLTASALPATLARVAPSSTRLPPWVR